MKKIIGAMSSVVAVFLILAMTLPVSASWNSDLGSGTAVAITDKDPFTIDTFLGVNAYYSEKSSKYTASELVVRFYKDAYSLDVSVSGTPSITTKGYEFKIPETPQNGDVVYSEEGHWAIVKSYSKSKGLITIFEQGNAKDGKAYKDRTLKYPSDSYTVFTPRSKTGYAYPTLINVDTGKTVTVKRSTVYDITTAAPETETTAAASKQETTKAAAKKTTASETTKAGKTTAKSEGKTSATTKPNFTTYVAEHEAEVVEASTFTTSAMPEGYEEFFTSGQNQDQSQNQDQTQQDGGAYDPNGDTQYYYTDTQAYDGNILETTQAVTESESKSVNPTLIFGIAMVGGIVLITVAGIVAGLVIKKRSEDD